MTDSTWPQLRVQDWSDTKDTLQLWLQIVGKIRMRKSPLVNHWWQSTFYVSPRGLATSAIPDGTGGVFDIEFDFLDRQMRIRTSGGGQQLVALKPKTVADFYAQTMSALDALGIAVRIQATPNEVEPAIPFAEDTEHSSYDAEAAELFWRQLIAVNRVMQEFRGSYVGKVSPVHFFWGAMDLACTRFSGRTAPTHPGGAPNTGDWVMVEAYSHELSSAGFWPGVGDEGAFYSYAYPEPDGYADYRVGPSDASYRKDLGEFLLTYEAVRTSASPDATLLEFLRSTYQAAADCGRWDRDVLEIDPTRWDHKSLD